MEFSPMKIDLTREQEKIVEDELKTGQFQTSEEMVGKALQVLHNKTYSAQSIGNGKQDQAVREMLEFVLTNRVRLEGDSVKDLIREGHRLGTIVCWTLPLRSRGSWKTNLAGNMVSQS